MSAALIIRPASERAFERLYKGHVHDVYRYVLAVLRNPADAEDVTQSTFLSAYRAFQRGERPELPRNWLLKIAHNECRQRFRMLARRPKEVEWDERVAAPSHDETIPTAEELRAALSHLSFNQRSALVMRELEGRTYAEIGQILDLSVSAVETLLFRARRALREQLEGGLTCGEAEAALVKRLDARLAQQEQRSLRAHLRECSECAALERKHRAQRAAMKRLGAVQLPPSLASFFGGASSVTGGAVAGSGVVAKAAAVVAAGVVAGGVGHQAVEAVAAGEKPRTSLPKLREVPRGFPQYAAADTPWTPASQYSAGSKGARLASARKPAGKAAAAREARIRGGVKNALSKRRGGNDGTATESSEAAAAGQNAAAPPSSGQAAQQPQAPPPSQNPVERAVETARQVVPPLPVEVPTPPVEPPKVEVPRLPVPVPPPPALPPPPPLLPPPPPPPLP